MICMFQEHSKKIQKNPFLIIPGSEIPKWFSHQKVGASMNLQVPSDLFYKCMGIAVCVVYVFRQHHPLDLRIGGSFEFTHYLRCSIKVNRVELYRGGSIRLPEECSKIESHHLLLRFKSFSRENHKKALSQSDANEFIQIEIKFELRGPGLEITKCGAHLVYEEDLNQTMGGCSITPYENDIDDSAKDNIIKRSRDDYDGDELVGPLNSNDVDVPHPKRIRLPNLIERFIPRLGNWIGNSSTQGQLGNSGCEEEEEGSQ
jgi:hypothetical protein